MDDEFDEVDDLDVVKFEDWDDEEDGEWEFFKIINLKCEEVFGCGEWKWLMKKNFVFKGKWKVLMIDNLDY